VETVVSDSLEFGEKPYHLRPMIGAQESIPIYPLRWKLRTQEHKAYEWPSVSASRTNGVISNVGIREFPSISKLLTLL
jgi:hypothetical protein